MSRPPSQQQKQPNRVPPSQPNERSINSSKSPYLNPNFLPSPHHGQSKSSSREARQQQHQQNEFNPNNSSQQQLNSLLHHPDSMPSNNNGMIKKPSLLSGYHNPSFSPNDRNDIIPMNLMGLPGESMPRFYSPSQAGPFNSSNSANFMNISGSNSLEEGNNTSNSNKNTSKTSRTIPQNNNPMSIATNQPQLNRPGTNPAMLSPSQQQQLLNSHQQILNSGFSPAVIAAATSALTSSNPQFSHLIQHQLHLQQQQQQLSHLQMFQAQMNQPSISLLGKHESSSVKKEPKEVPTSSVISSNPSPKIQQPAVVSTPPSSSQTSCYVPEVEAISPTPEDQKENSNLQAVKEKIITEICKVEKDIASTQYQYDLLEKKQKEMKELQARPLVDENGNKYIVFKTTLAEKIYKENRKMAEESHSAILKPNYSVCNIPNEQQVETSFDEDIPVYHEFSDTKLSQDLRKRFDTVMKQRLIQFFKRQLMIKKQKEKLLIEQYDTLHTEWQKKVDKIENNSRKKQKDAKYREFYEKVFPELRKAREEKERLIQKQKAEQQAKLEEILAKQKAELEATGNETTGFGEDTKIETIQTESTTTQLPSALLNNLSLENNTQLNAIEEERKRIYQLAVVPPLQIDERLKRYKFINNNGFVKDPVALYKSAKNQVFWNEAEKEIFLDKLLIFGKNFEIIATFLDKKGTQDCIEYYYLTKKKINFKLLYRKQQRKRKNQKPNIAAILAGNNNNNSGSGSSSTGNGNSGGLSTTIINNTTFNNNSSLNSNNNCTGNQTQGNGNSDYANLKQPVLDTIYSMKFNTAVKTDGLINMILDESGQGSSEDAKITSTHTGNHKFKDTAQLFTDSESEEKFGRIETSIKMTINRTLNKLTKYQNNEFLTETIRNALHNDLPAELCEFESKPSIFDEKLKLLKQKDNRNQALESNIEPEFEKPKEIKTQHISLDTNPESLMYDNDNNSEKSKKKLAKLLPMPPVQEEVAQHKTLGSLVNMLIKQNVPSQIEGMSEIKEYNSSVHSNLKSVFSSKKSTAAIVTNTSESNSSPYSNKSESSSEKSTNRNESSESATSNCKKESKPAKIVIDDNDDDIVVDENNNNLNLKTKNSPGENFSDAKKIARGLSSNYDTELGVIKPQSSSLTHRLLAEKREASKLSMFHYGQTDRKILGNLIESEFSKDPIPKETPKTKPPEEFINNVKFPKKSYNDRYSPEEHFLQQMASTSKNLATVNSMDNTLNEPWNLSSKKVNPLKSDHTLNKQNINDTFKPNFVVSSSNKQLKPQLIPDPFTDAAHLSDFAKQLQQYSNEQSAYHQKFNFGNDLISQARSYGHPLSQESPPLSHMVMGSHLSYPGIMPDPYTKAGLINMDLISVLSPQLLASHTHQEQQQQTTEQYKTKGRSPEQYTPGKTPFFQNYLPLKKKTLNELEKIDQVQQAPRMPIKRARSTSSNNTPTEMLEQQHQSSNLLHQLPQQQSSKRHSPISQAYSSNSSFNVDKKKLKSLIDLGVMSSVGSSSHYLNQMSEQGLTNIKNLSRSLPHHSHQNSPILAYTPYLYSQKNIPLSDSVVPQFSHLCNLAFSPASSHPFLRELTPPPLTSLPFNQFNLNQTELKKKVYAEALHNQQLQQSNKRSWETLKNHQEKSEYTNSPSQHQHSSKKNSNIELKNNSPPRTQQNYNFKKKILLDVDQRKYEQSQTDLHNSQKSPHLHDQNLAQKNPSQK